MDQLQGPFAGNFVVPSMRELCLKDIAGQLTSNVHLKVQQLLPNLLPDDAVEVLDQFIALHGARTGVCPYRLLLPRPRVFLLSAHLRGKLLRICRHASPDTASLAARDTQLCQISSASSQVQLADSLEFGAFLCEMGWYDDGMIILEQIYSVLAQNPYWQTSQMSLDCAYRQLVAAVEVGRVTAAKQLADRVSLLFNHGVGRQSGLLSAAAAALARLHLLTENWPEAVRLLSAALEVLPAAVPADLAAELPRLVAELLLSRGHTKALIELAPQALSAAYRHWGELHSQTLAAIRMMADFAMASGLSGVAQDLSERRERLTGEMFGDCSPLRQRGQLDRVLLTMRLASGDTAVAESNSPPSTVRPASIPLPGNSCWLLDRALADCQWLDEQIKPLLGSQQGRQYAGQLGARIMAQLEGMARVCEEMFGPDSLRLARVLTETGRQRFNLEMDDLLQPQTEGGAVQSEQELLQALAIQSSHGLSGQQRDVLVTRITLGCQYTYSRVQYLLEGERLLRDALTECYGNERRQHLDLVEHCLRGLSFIYETHEDAERVAAMDDLLQTVQAQRQRLSSQRVPANGLAALLPRRPWTQHEMTRQLSAALRTVAPPGGPTVALPGPQAAAGAGAQGGGSCA